MDNLASSPEIIGAIIGGVFLLLTTIIGGWFNVRAAQIRVEAERAAQASRARPRKAGYPTGRPEQKQQKGQKEQKRPLPIWLLVTGATIGTALLIGGLALSGVFSIFPPPATPTPTETSSSTAVPVDIPIPTADASKRLGFPDNPVENNGDWTPIVQTFDGIEMVLVPVGCFTMGDEASYEDEQPPHRQCFEQPFWIGRTEVTNAQFSSSGTLSGANLPRETVLWREAAEFCDIKAGRLPTEAEWEYAARGPDNLLYPWGNSIQSDDRAIYSTKEDTKKGPSSVGSKPRGASWVGALDMSGNVWEWVSSLYRPYPYDRNDGREISRSDEKRVVRGGSFEGYDIRASERSSRTEAQYTSVGFRCSRDWSPSDPLNGE